MTKDHHFYKCFRYGTFEHMEINHDETLMAVCGSGCKDKIINTKSHPQSSNS